MVTDKQRFWDTTEWWVFEVGNLVRRGCPEQARNTEIEVFQGDVVWGGLPALDNSVTSDVRTDQRNQQPNLVVNFAPTKRLKSTGSARLRL